MNKKALLIAVLQKLLPYREQAEGFLAFVESGYCSEASIDELIKIVRDALQHTTQEHNSHIIHKLEQEYSTTSLQEIEEAETMLDALLITQDND